MVERSESQEYWRHLPRLAIEPRGEGSSRFTRAIDIEYPHFHKRYAQHFRKCPKLWKKVAERFKVILDSVDWGVDLVRFHFLDTGIAMQIEPGNACCVCPSISLYDGYESHNVDRSDYCILLFVLLSIAMDEMSQQAIVWDGEEPTRDLDPDFPSEEVYVYKVGYTGQQELFGE